MTGGFQMKKLAIAVVAASTLFGSAAYAQGVDIGIGPGGAGVRVDNGYHGYDRGRDHDRNFRRSRDETVIIKRDRHHDWRDHDRGRRVYIERD
jgi:opacity protein-like surface antigen